MRYEKIDCDACGKEVKPGEKVVESKVSVISMPRRDGDWSSASIITTGSMVAEPKAGQFHYGCVSVGDDYCRLTGCRCR